MPSPKNIFKLLSVYCASEATHILDLSQFISFTQKYVERYGKEYTALNEFKNVENIVKALEALKQEKKCSLIYDGQLITRIAFPYYFVERIHKEYRKVEHHFDYPFPSEKSFRVNIPSSLILAINVKADFLATLKQKNSEELKIFKLVFPQGVESMLVTSDLLWQKLLEYALYKIRAYLDGRGNARYLYHKLSVIFTKQEQVVKEMLENIQGKTSQAIANLREPSDLSFRFFSHLASLIVQEYKKKDNKTALEHSISQAAYLIGYYNVFYRGAQQKRKAVQEAFKNLDVCLRKPPYLFSRADIHNLKDPNGKLLSTIYSNSELHKYLDDKTKPQSGQSYPEIVRLKPGDAKGYYINKDVLLPFVLKKIYETSREFKTHYLNIWLNDLRANRKSLAMLNDGDFLHDVKTQLRKERPLLNELLNYELLFLVKEETKTKPDMDKELNRLFDKVSYSLIPLPDILWLNRRELLKAVKNQLHFWEKMPLVRQLVVFFKQMFTTFEKPGKTALSQKSFMTDVTSIHKGSEKGSQAYAAQNGTVAAGSAVKTFTAPETVKKTITKQAQLAAYRKAVYRLKQEFLSKGKTLEGSLEELSEKWNPLYDPKAKADLVVDVNALIRDFMRSVKKVLYVKHPDAERVQNLASDLSRSNAFSEIKRKDYLRRYIELYMIKILSER